MASTESESPPELAAAVGRYALGEVSLGKAAELADLSRWEFEEVLRDAGVDKLYGPRDENALAEEVDTACDRST